MSAYDTETQHQRPAARTGGGHQQGFAPQEWVGYGRRPWAETKPFFLTSEFLALVLTVAGVLIASAVVDDLDAGRAWTLVAGLAAAYMLSRGLAKSGTRDPNPDR